MGEKFEVVAEGVGFGEGGVEGAGKVFGVAAGEEKFFLEGGEVVRREAAFGAGDDFGKTAGVADEDGRADGHGFGGGQAEAFVERGVEQ